MKVFNVTWLKQSKDQQDYRKKEKKGKRPQRNPFITRNQRTQRKKGRWQKYS